MGCGNASRRHGKVALNVVVFLIIFGVLVIGALNLVNTSYPALRCHRNETQERDFSHPYRGDTITTVMIITLSVVPALFEFIASEWVINSRPVNPYNYHTEDTRWSRTKFYAFRWYRDYICGMVFMLLLVEAGKLTAGSPRPHWIYTCMPRFPEENCKLGWVSNYTCSNTRFSPSRMIDARKSFPSGHSALGFYQGIFMVLYQHFRFNGKKLGPVITMLLHTIWVTWAFVCALSRVSDFRHHPLDVTVGGLLGFILALLTAVYMCQKFQKKFRFDDHKDKIITGINGNAAIMNDGYSSSNGAQLTSVVTPSSDLISNSTTTAIPNGGIRLANGGSGKRNGLPSFTKLLSKKPSITAEAAEAREMEIM